MLLRHRPTGTHGREVTELMPLGHLTGTIGTERCGEGVPVLVVVVHAAEETYGPVSGVALAEGAELGCGRKVEVHELVAEGSLLVDGE